MSAATEYLSAHAADYHHCPGLRALIRKEHCLSLLARPTIDEIPDTSHFTSLLPIYRPPACRVCPMGGSFHQRAPGPQNEHKSSGGSTEGRARSSARMAYEHVRGDSQPVSSPAPQKHHAPRPQRRCSSVGEPRRVPGSTPGAAKKRLPLTDQPFSSRLQLARKNADIGQRDLGKALGIPQSHISAVEHGRSLNRTYTNKLRAWVARQEGR
jgi:ribosome-binding protein aMBF1 (putative translation factor)